MTFGAFLFVCILCFTAGGCLGVLAMICAKRPTRGVLAGWCLYLAICMALAFTIGKAVLL